MDKTNQFALSSGQKGLWLLHQLDPDSDRYHMPLTFNYASHIEVGVLENLLTLFVQRHDMLHSTFVQTAGEPVRQINEPGKTAIDEHDFSGIGHTDLLLKIRQISAQPFDLEQGPLFKAAVLKGSENGDILLITIHHIVFDGASLKIMCDELAGIHQSLMDGQPLDAPEYGYHDFIQWQQAWLLSQEAESSKAYWLDKLSGELPLLNLPVNTSIDTNLPVRGEFIKFTVPEHVVNKFKGLANENGCSEYLVWLMAYFSFLSRYTSQADVIIGTPSMGRPDAKFDDLVGYFVNLIPLRCQVDPTESFIDLLRRFKNEIYAALMHADFPLPELIKVLGDNRQRGDQPLFQSSFVWTVTDHLRSQSNSQLGLTIFPLIHESGEQNLSLELLITGEGIEGVLKYRANLFSHSTVLKIKDSYINFIDSICIEPTSEIKELSLVTEDEEDYLLHTLNNTHADYSHEMCIHQGFEQQVVQNPDHPAVTFNNKTLSYSELNSQANKLAHFLIEQGIRPDEFVGVCLERSLEMVIGIMAILKAGGAYLPLDPSYPPGRLSHIMRDSQLSWVLTQQKLINMTQGDGRDQCVLDAEGWCDKIDAYSASNITVDGLTANNLAYLIYTSGSTGKPKGVMIEHHQVINMLQYFEEQAPCSKNFNATLWTNLSFDVSVYEIFSTLVFGGTLMIPDAELRLLPSNYFNWMSQANIKCAYLPPFYISQFRQWLTENESLSLERLLVGVEPINESLLRTIERLIPSVTIINGYGPTEATVCCSAYNLKTNAQSNQQGSAPIGRPLANYSAYVLDKNLSLLPAGTVGELHIGGTGLARGYLNQPELTATKFIQNPFNEESTERLYKSGDLVRYRADGNLEFVGRLDHQVKIRGFRIELAEVELELSAHPEVVMSLVVAHQEGQQEKQLIAYFTTESLLVEADLIEDIRTSLSCHLPAHMVPSLFIKLHEFPLTPNDKIDRKSLPKPNAVELYDQYIPPQGKVELGLARIWSELLKIPVDQIGANANFFELGGHSLLVARMINEIKQTMGLELTYQFVFSQRLLNDMSAKIESQLKTDALVESLAAPNAEFIEEIEW